ncbi:hypothetical protein C8Q80DRAFT_1357439 [Daedaleopsis nitida]|nr:hypothetical protein C8Q80DRAFT_1357439 [Daedaleopsis nitida]
MQFFTSVAAVALTVFGSVSALPSGSQNPAGQCSTGTVRCCSSMEPASSDKGQTILQALSLDVPTESSLGLTCTPVNTGSVGGGQHCDAMPLCCNGNEYSGLSIGCSPINLLM